jgi:phospholipid/cholesterol/gamma-HCH transport system substrate-binding protein
LKISREVKIALVFVVALGLFIWGFNFLNGKDVFSKQRTFYAIYDQVNGLNDANPVVINGFKVGQVQGISFLPDGSGRILVEFIVTNNDVNIPTNSIAKLFSSDILGSRAIEIILGDTNLLAVEGDTLGTQLGATLGEEVSVQMLPIKQKFENVMSQLDSVLAVIQSVFNEGTRQNLLLSFESIKMTIQNLEHTTYNIDTLVVTQKYKLAAIIGNVESISANIKNNNDHITNIITNFSNLSDTLTKANIASTINNANLALKEFNDIIGKVNRGEGSLGMLINNDALYKNLENSSVQLNQLIEDIKLNPQRYLHFSIIGRGKRQNSYEPPDGTTVEPPVQDPKE